MPSGRERTRFGPKPERTSAADADQLADDLAHAVCRFDGRRHAQDVGDQPADRFGDRGGF